MKRILSTIILSAAMFVTASAERAANAADITGLPGIEPQAMRTLALESPMAADEDSGIEGMWHFRMGDYYFEDSSFGTVVYDYEASFYQGYLVFADETESALQMASSYDESTGTLTFTAMALSDFYGYGILAQYPSVYDEENEKFVPQTIKGQYDAESGTITFAPNAGMQWALCDYNGYPQFILDAYTFEGAFRTLPDEDEPGDEPGEGDSDGIGAVTPDGGRDAVVEYYNAQGVRMNGPVEGQLMIVRRGSKIRKIRF